MDIFKETEVYTIEEEDVVISPMLTINVKKMVKHDSIQIIKDTEDYN